MATIGDILAAQGRFLTRPDMDGEQYRAGMRFRCRDSGRGSEAVDYGENETHAWLAAFDASGAPSNLELSDVATYRLRDPRLIEREAKMDALVAIIFG